MNKVVIWLSLALAGALAFVFLWSISGPEPVKPEQFSVVYVDGVRCIVFRGYRKGGLSCDWKKE